MPNTGPYKKCQICWDNRIKQDSYSWMSKLLLKERIIEIGLELVICRKKLWMVRVQLFFTSEKNRSNTRNEKLFLLLGCGFNKDRTFFQTSSWQYWSTNAQITMQPTKQVSTFPHLIFLFISWEDKDKESPFLWSYPLVGFIQYPRRPILVWKSFWDVLHCFFW